MNIKIRRVATGYQSRGQGWRKGFLLAYVDGYGVALREGKGWSCQCPDPDCTHADTVADLIDPDVLARIENGRQK